MAQYYTGYEIQTKMLTILRGHTVGKGNTENGRSVAGYGNVVAYAR